VSVAAFTEKRHALADRGHDFYQTPRVATEALIRLESRHLPATIWECACGAGAISEVLVASGYDIVSTDLVARPCAVPMSAGIDFLLETTPFNGGIVTNPPYRLAEQFVRKALDLSPYVAMLMRLAFLAGSRRRLWLRQSGLTRVHISSRRLPMMHRDGWDGPISNSATDFAWFVWDRTKPHLVPEPAIHWFDWQEDFV
jgi:hypothetical protein